MQNTGKHDGIPMTPSVTLRCGAMRCEVSAQLGAAIAGLWRGELPVLRSTPGGGAVPGAAVGLLPAGAVFEPRGPCRPCCGTAPAIRWSRNFAPEPHAIHGVAWMRPWEVLEADDDFALLSFEHRADASWPFAFDCSQAFRLTPDALEVTLSATNQSDQPAPFGLGWHPFFVKRPGSRVRFEAGGPLGDGAGQAADPAARQPRPGRGLRHAGHRPLFRRLARRASCCRTRK